MLIELLNQINSQIQNIDIEENGPIMLDQIDHARPDFRQYLYQNAPDKKVADLTDHAIARGILTQIKAIPELGKTMVSQLESQSSSAVLRCSIAGVLVYLVQSRDLIPDNAPEGYGFVDYNLIVRAGFIEYMNFIPSSANKIGGLYAWKKCASRKA